MRLLPELPDDIRAVERGVSEIHGQLVKLEPSLLAIGGVVDRLPGGRRRKTLDPPS